MCDGGGGDPSGDGNGGVVYEVVVRVLTSYCVV